MKDTMCGLVKEVNAPSGLVYHTDLPIPEIAAEVGFLDYNYFSRVYKSVYGKSPKTYRRATR